MIGVGVADGASAPRQAILAAALDELRLRGIDNFTIEHVAGRAGVEPAVIVRGWGDRRVLVLDAMFSEGHQELPIPDTGSLAGDLAGIAATLAMLSTSQQWREAFRRRLPSDGRDADFTEIRMDFRRARITEFALAIARAAERGEVREGVDPEMAMKMFFTSCVSDLIFDDTGVQPDYVAMVVDIFLRGITPV